MPAAMPVRRHPKARRCAASASPRRYRPRDPNLPREFPRSPFVPAGIDRVNVDIRRAEFERKVAGGGFVRDSAEEIVQSGDADAVAFGRWFSSNPDLPERLRRNAPLTPYVRDAVWGGDERNYTDFPILEDTSV
jgi:2,4-dienoyl-CoA reductase-like NADH-dependent reductase (Old Yellow Enzyme family)